jgi:hypothetical protein
MNTRSSLVSLCQTRTHIFVPRSVMKHPQNGICKVVMIILIFYEQTKKIYGYKILVDTKIRIQCEDSTCVGMTFQKVFVGMVHILDSLS